MGKTKVMVVDDEKDFLRIVELNLLSAGRYEVMTLESAKDIISRVHDFKPNLILLDILMPGIKGLEVCELLNNDFIGRDIPVIILSALNKDADRLNALKMGVADYLVKPIDKDALLDSIDKALRFKR